MYHMLYGLIPCLHFALTDEEDPDCLAKDAFWNEVDEGLKNANLSDPDEYAKLDKMVFEASRGRDMKPDFILPEIILEPLQYGTGLIPPNPSDPKTWGKPFYK